MRLNLKAVNKLLEKEFNGNITALAESLGISRTTASQVINNNTDPKAKFFCGLIQYCEQNNLDFKKYIFLNINDNNLNNNRLEAS